MAPPVKRLLAALLLVCLIGGLTVTAVRHLLAGPIVGVVRLHGGAAQVIAIDARAGLAFVPDAIDSPALGANGQPILRVIDTASGRLLRSLALKQRPRVLLAGQPTGRLLLTTFPDPQSLFTLVALDSSGAERWATGLPLPPALRAARSGSGAIVGMAIGLGPGGIVLDEQTGHFLAFDGVTFFSSSSTSYTDDQLFLLDAASGRLLHTLLLPALPNAIALDAGLHHAFVTAGLDPLLWLVDSRTGALLRTIHLSCVPLALAVDSQAHRVLVAGNPQQPGLRLLDARNGRVLATLPGGYGRVLVDEATGRAFAAYARRGSGPGFDAVRVIDTRSGRVLRTIGLDGSVWALALDSGRGRVFATTIVDPAHPYTVVAAIDAGSGELQRTISLDTTVNTIAVDEGSGHLLLSGSGDVPAAHNGLADLQDRLHRILPVVPRPAAPPATALPSTPQGSITVLDLDR